MKTIELTEKQYKALLSLKNYISMRVHEITNQDALDAIHKVGVVTEKIKTSYDFEPKYSFGECIKDVVGSVLLEQKTGEVNYIT